MSQNIQVEQIPIEKTKISKFNVRKDVGDISELVLSVKSVGVLEPVVARQIGSGFEVIIGSRRLVAARKAGLKTIPAIVKKLTDSEAIVESLTENLQRGEIGEEDIVRAFKALQSLDSKHWTEETFAKTLGKSKAWVSRLLSAYGALQLLKESGVAKGMTSRPSQAEREKGIVPLEHLEVIETAIRSASKSGAIKQGEVNKKRVELAEAVLDLPTDDAISVVDRFKMYPEKPIEKVKEEALAARTGVAIKTYLSPSMARQIEEKTGRKVEDAFTQVLEKGLESIPASGESAKPPMHHWAEELTQDPMSIQVRNWWKWNRDRLGDFDFFTTHYSGKDIETFAETLKANGVRTLIDVRDTPFSQFRPEFNKESLGKTLEGKGIRYEHHPELGVPREQRDKLAKSGDWSALFEWYDRNVASKISAVKVSQKPIAFMCVEKDPRKCHRHRIALALEKTGLKSLDI